MQTMAVVMEGLESAFRYPRSPCHEPRPAPGPLPRSGRSASSLGQPPNRDIFDADNRDIFGAD